MLDRGVPRAGDASEIEMPVRLDDQLEVPGCPMNDIYTVRQILRQERGQLALELRQTISWITLP
jgi:hypothetical protein